LVRNLEELDKNNNYVLFVSQRFNSEDLGFKNTKWKIVKTNFRWHTIEEQWRFPHILEKENLDLMHFPYFSVPIFYKRPFVITIHDLIIDHYPTGKASTLPSPIYYFKLLSYKFIIKQAATRAQQIIAVSQATKYEIVQHLGVSKDKVVVTYEGVDEKVNSSKHLVASKKPNYKLPATRYFLYVGNAYPHKNLERLVEAFALIVQEFPDVKLILVGKQDFFYKRLQEKVVDLQIEKQIIFAGFVSEDILLDYYKYAIATILPSLMEGFGLTGLEAMKNGCLVLASEIPSLKEIYQDAAIYFDPLAVESIHVTIRKVLEKQYKFDMYKKRGERRVAFFSWEKMTEETLKIYESSIGL
jgi:glycosyltransferase involved in cell wall biosynthesis